MDSVTELPEGYELRPLPNEDDGTGGGMLELIGPEGTQLTSGSAAYGREHLKTFAHGHAAGIRLADALTAGQVSTLLRMSRAAREMNERVSTVHERVECPTCAAPVGERCCAMPLGWCPARGRVLKTAHGQRIKLEVPLR